MKITDYIANAGNKTLFSFEVLPPLKGESLGDMIQNIEPLMEFDPSFVDVTYHREDYVLKPQSDGSFIKKSTKKRPGTVAIFELPNGEKLPMEVELFTWEKLDYVDKVKSAFKI